MSHKSEDARDSFVLGHRLEVFPSGDGRWRVAVDGERISKSFPNAYAAWAMGAAESYRQGKVTATTPRDHD